MLSAEWLGYVVGKVYKRKRHSRALCKPHKMGWAPRLKDGQRALLKAHLAEIRAARLANV